MTYAHWEQVSNAVARGLTATGVAAGDRVGLLFDNSGWLDYAVTYFATLKAGAVAVPVSSRLTQGEAGHILEHCGATTLVAQADHVDLAQRACPDGTTCLEADIGELSAGRSGDPFPVERTETDLAEIIYTSGTTGVPRGVAAPHGNIATDAVAAGMIPGATFLHAIPLATFGGTYAMMVRPVANRWSNVVMSRFDAERHSALIEEHRVTIAYLVPAMARLIVDSGAPARHDVSSLEMIWFGAAPMPPDTLQRLADAFPGAGLLNIYGATEGGGAGTAMFYDRERPLSVGTPVGGSRIRIVDEDGDDCLPGETAEVWIARPAGVPGRYYYGDEAASAQTFVGDWVRTGDAGYRDADGYLHLVDRIKDIIIRGGYNISSVEVEGVLHAHPAVAEAAVVGIPHDVLGEDVAAVVVPRAGAQPSVEELLDFCRQRLADYKVPRHVEFAIELPRNLMGKVLKRELRSRLATSAEAAGRGRGTA